METAPFTSSMGPIVASWVTSADEAYWLAPGTVPPITSEKIGGWKKPGGHCLLGFVDSPLVPVAYGELNPMRYERKGFWIGHVIVNPLHRGRGVGGMFVSSILDHAFGTLKARRVSLVVFPENVAAIRCYTHCGFCIVGEERHSFRPESPPVRLLRLEVDSCSFKIDRRRQALSGAHSKLSKAVSTPAPDSEWIVNPAGTF